ncbi:hypothetical protein AVEN_221744-1 [Araneus ventricosus]|uniref:Mariner Mos1 transposase n=1 Tax=Araneus ventricosus TaxID=182803 RepID=A0A4Y2CRB1_ARAVE|nr:hypothetical protein AVEN_209171-1 [Araneus ventricosus]GBM07001.1 hypothetical protein AVEN_221744-1 [Araneus ventricosus]
MSIDWVPEDQTVSQRYCTVVFTVLPDRVRRKRHLRRNKSLLLHPAHNSVCVKTFLVQHKITKVEHQFYSPDLAPCNLFLFPVDCAKGSTFETVDEVKVKPTEVLKGLSGNDLRHCFEKWKIRLERCRNRGGEFKVIISRL